MFDQNPPPNMRKLPFLPEEILVDEILARLRVKSLSRFKCVSKSWLSLIESDRFIKIHYRNSARNPRVIALNHPQERSIIKIGDSLQSLLDSKEGPVPTKIEPIDSVRLLGCCNGVLCWFNEGRRRLLLWNPATRVSVELPSSPFVELGSCPVKWGFGWDESSGAYKVFVVLLSKVISGWVYSSNTNSWRKSSSGSDTVFLGTGPFLCGNLHWTDWSLPQIECFDLGREEFGRIELPFEDEVWKNLYFPGLGVISGSLGLVLDVDVEKSLDVWVMKEYGVKDSWFKILTFPTSALFNNTYYFPLFGEGPNGEIFVGYEKQLTVYSPKDDAFSTITGKDPFVEPLITYVESLVSPKIILDATNTTS